MKRRRQGTDGFCDLRTYANDDDQVRLIYIRGRMNSLMHTSLRAAHSDAMQLRVGLPVGGMYKSSHKVGKLHSSALLQVAKVGRWHSRWQPLRYPLQLKRGDEIGANHSRIK
jgi:hypothetical protein